MRAREDACLWVVRFRCRFETSGKHQLRFIFWRPSEQCKLLNHGKYLPSINWWNFPGFPETIHNQQYLTDFYLNLSELNDVKVTLQDKRYIKVDAFKKANLMCSVGESMYFPFQYEVYIHLHVSIYFKFTAR